MNPCEEGSPPRSLNRRDNRDWGGPKKSKDLLIVHGGYHTTQALILSSLSVTSENDFCRQEVKERTLRSHMDGGHCHMDGGHMYMLCS